MTKPTSVFKVERSAICEFDFDGKHWGAESEEVDKRALSFSTVKQDEEFECFNFIFEVDDSKINNLMIGFEKSLLPLRHAEIYFHPKKIKWIRSN